MIKFCFLIIFITGIIVSQHQLDSYRKKSLKPLISPPPYIQYYSIGYNELLADTLWMRAIQDMDYCEEKISKGISDNTVPCKGDKWLYSMLDTVTNLSPHFRMPYAVGSVALQYLVGDSESASIFYDKSVNSFPKDWNILYKAAHHAMAVENNLSKAAELLKRSAENGGGDWFYSLAARLYDQSGQRDLSILIYKQTRDSGVLDEAMLKHIRRRLNLTDVEVD